MFLLFDIQTGVAGDMILGALFDMGLDFGEWKNRMEGLGLSGVSPSIRKVIKHGISATKFSVSLPHEHAHRGLSEIRGIISQASLPGPVKESSLRIFTRLAEVEAEIHGQAAEQVHFHELGALDAIVDIVGACLGFEMMGVTGFLCTPLTFGSGTVDTAHGKMAVPVPATLALSRGFPSVRTGLPGELCTPTGAAVVTTLSRPVSARWKSVLQRHGYGAGTRDLSDRANVLRLCLLQEEKGETGSGEGGLCELYQVECNLDNMEPELIAFAAEKLFDAGCRDVWQEPLYMKKNRAAIKLCALAEPERLDEALSVIAEETSTGGMRWFPVRRWVAEKGAAEADTRYGRVSLKKIAFTGKPARYSPEFESCRALAAAAGAPLIEVYREALAAAQAAAAAIAAGKENTGAGPAPSGDGTPHA